MAAGSVQPVTGPVFFSKKIPVCPRSSPLVPVFLVFYGTFFFKKKPAITADFFSLIAMFIPTPAKR
jgi:hypothetical protein